MSDIVTTLIVHVALHAVSFIGILFCVSKNLLFSPTELFVMHVSLKNYEPHVFYLGAPRLSRNGLEVCHQISDLAIDKLNILNGHSLNIWRHWAETASRITAITLFRWFP